MTAVWAHRGASAYAPENTLPAFLLAERMGADGVELDVQLTADGEVVVIHDETMERTTDGTGAVAELTLAELRRVDACNGLGEYAGTVIPTLAEVFTALAPGRLTINVELKALTEFRPGIEPVVAELIAAHDLADRIVVSSFNHYSLKTLQQLAPTLRLGLLLAENLYLPWEYAAEFGAAAIHPRWEVLRVPGMVEYARAAGIAVHPWTVNTEADLAWVFGLGVDAVITDHPDRALRIRGAATGP
jgi:glycerophosphoryl diester phosphodiesterase